jgi:hypothetical protein
MLVPKTNSECSSVDISSLAGEMGLLREHFGKGSFKWSDLATAAEIFRACCMVLDKRGANNGPLSQCAKIPGEIEDEGMTEDDDADDTYSDYPPDPLTPKSIAQFLEYYPVPPPDEDGEPSAAQRRLAFQFAKFVTLRALPALDLIEDDIDGDVVRTLARHFEETPPPRPLPGPSKEQCEYGYELMGLVQRLLLKSSAKRKAEPAIEDDTSQDKGRMALERAYQAVTAYSRSEFKALVPKVIHRLQRLPATGIYGDDYNYNTLWDEYCHEVQEGPFDLPWDWGGSPATAWEQTIPAFINDVIDRIPPHAAVLLSVFARAELDEEDDAGLTGSIWLDGIRQVLRNWVDEQAGGRSLHRFGPWRHT